jgi:hypothetical protein
MQKTKFELFNFTFSDIQLWIGPSEATPASTLLDGTELQLNCLLVPVFFWAWIFATWCNHAKDFGENKVQKCQISKNIYNKWWQVSWLIYIYIYITLASKYHISNIWDFTWDSTLKMRMLLKSFVSTSIWFLNFFSHVGECFKY